MIRIRRFGEPTLAAMSPPRAPAAPDAVSEVRDGLSRHQEGRLSVFEQLHEG